MMTPSAIRQSQRYVSPPGRDEFNRQVWDLVRQIPPGKVSTYGQIAALIGPSPGADPKSYLAYGARWVGGAMAACPEGVPWQRVINSQGKISLRPAGGGSNQRQMLESEGVTFDDRDRVDLETFAWEGPSTTGSAPAENVSMHQDDGADDDLPDDDDEEPLEGDKILKDDEGEPIEDEDADVDETGVSIRDEDEEVDEEEELIFDEGELEENDDAEDELFDYEDEDLDDDDFDLDEDELEDD